jgi:hypothetical protein
MEPLGWVITGFEEDFGIDYDVQVFENGSPTGLWFKIQLKSSASSDVSSNGTFVSVQLSYDHAKHYALEIRDPTLLVHADVVAKKVYWTAPQLDGDLIRKITNSHPPSTVTVRIPTANALPETAEQFLTKLDELYVALGNRTIVNSALSSFAEALKYEPNEEKLREEFQRRADYLKQRKIHDLFVEGRYEEVRRRAENIVSDPDSTIENRFLAQDNIGSANWAEAITRNTSQPQLPAILLENAKLLHAMSRKGPPHIRLYALIARTAAELEVLAVNNWGLTILHEQHKTAAGNPFMAIGAHAARVLSTHLVVAKYNQCLRLARYASTFKGRWFLPRALMRIPQGASTFIIRADRMGIADQTNTGEAFHSSILQICKLIAWIGEESGDQEAIAIATSSALLPIRSMNTDAFRWAASEIDRITDDGVKGNAIELMGNHVRRWSGTHTGDVYNPDPYLQILENEASALGIDISDKDSALYRGIHVAAKDNSPQRVLKTCVHIVTSLGAVGPTARKIRNLFGTEMAASKIIHCSLHDYHYEARDFDSAAAHFTSLYCATCPDREPRSPEWRYTQKVQEEFQEKHRNFIKLFNSTGAGFRFTEADEP